MSSACDAGSSEVSQGCIDAEMLHALYHDSPEIQVQIVEKLRKILSKGQICGVTVVHKLPCESL